MKVNFKKLANENKDNIYNMITAIKDCANAETVVELSVERYKELLDYEFRYKELMK